MRSLHLLSFAVATVAFGASSAVLAAPADAQNAAASGSCRSGPLTLVQRRIVESSQDTATLARFVQRTKPIYQLSVDDAAAFLEADRASGACPVVAAASPDKR